MDMDAIKAQLKQLADRVDTLGVRERGLIFVAILGVLYMIASNIVFAPLRAEQTRLEREVKTKYDQIKSVDAQLNALVSGSGGDEKHSRISSLKQQLAELDAGMDRMTAGVVNPKEMAKLLEQMLLRNKNLELIKLEALVPKSIDDQSAPLDQGSTATNAATPVPGAAVYRHGMRIEFKGRYFDVVEYLKALEQLPWKVFWGEVSLETDQYPVSKVTLVIYTLSRYRGWIGA